jgi:hypothetical protein
MIFSDIWHNKLLFMIKFIYFNVINLKLSFNLKLLANYLQITLIFVSLCKFIFDIYFNSYLYLVKILAFWMFIHNFAS